MSRQQAFVSVVVLALAAMSGCGTSAPTSPSPAQLVISSSVNTASVPVFTAMTLTASGCTPTGGVFAWTVAGGTMAPSTGPSIVLTTGLVAGTFGVTAAGSGCLAGLLTYTIAPVAPTTFTYTMAGMPDGTDVQVSLNPTGTIVKCGGPSSNGQMVCAVTLTPGVGYITDVTNAFTGQKDCKGLTASNGTITAGGSTDPTTGCPVLFVR